MKHSEKSSTILMFVVFFLSFIVLWNVADLISKVDVLAFFHQLLVAAEH